MKYFATIFITIFLVGCGYQPISKISHNLVGDRVFIDVIIDKNEPKNSVFIKDAVREGIASRLNKNLSSKNSANTFINVKTKSLSYQPTVYDEYGYITSYKATLVLIFETKFKDDSVSEIQTSGEYDFNIAKRIKNIRYADSIISERERYQAIKEASKEAFDEYVSKLALKGNKNGSN
ncbi:putative lipooligosaccharide transport system, OM component (LptE family) [Campylobacter pinnipediorum subsp. caledonicus]|uniref:Putative lipooligosaccharide transport system, OM component (LptE family) n=1 Tax=Campylobacter pinnipediorum subsp. caledonicus TaxID=1874362 RepID=A0A1S6U9T6_9BACT|nr:LPS assembly lipoprotein LptE [Campylobacter pinnipediorum]AQW86848.1 putative lipooligosaccharide transport system, OM component (LptE family) [Campylobacter pinnipediorum subsp. caledonicus]AQW88503.1 putative lipooligosaccharide transport system, OM component (LptE family) [Campylobacter pinnipediorum subsp. caledonicus]OPA71052.1 penicillin-binding protein [Campylobacter pinnipediorum subsp. caledonicus]